MVTENRGGDGNMNMLADHMPRKLRGGMFDGRRKQKGESE